MKLAIGSSPHNLKPVSFDLASLLESRLLVQANSGGGKSVMLRYLLEQTYGEVQQIVLDVEDEFYKRSSRDSYLVRLANRKLVTRDRGMVRAAKTLFE